MEIIAQVEGHQELSGSRLLEEATRKRLPAVMARVLMRVTAGRVYTSSTGEHQVRACYVIRK